MLPSSVRLAFAPTLACLLLAMSPTCQAQLPASKRGTDLWRKMPILTPEQKKAGVSPGGEGCQWPRGPVVVSDADPNFLLLPIDVGGLYRSLDGGKTWNQASVGWNARGANHFAVDPKNATRVLGVAGNSMDYNADWGAPPHGVYLSTNKAASWKQTFAVRDGIGGAVAFDANSYDAGKGYCTTAYYLSPRQGLFKSTDGGETWNEIAKGDAVVGRVDRDWTQGGTITSLLEVDARTGALYVGGGKGLHKSADGGKTWEKLTGEEVYGLDVLADGAVYWSGKPGAFVSRDSGKRWDKLAASGLAQNGKAVERITVSPADPNRMLAWIAGDNWNWVRYVSQDGGKTFATVETKQGDAPMPQNARQGYFAWNPKDANIAYALGGDWVTRSTDGGKTFQWYNNGYNGVMLGGLMNFSVSAPNTVFLAFQDYNGAFTNDGGTTWNYRDVSGKGWGGQCYGGYALDATTMWYGDAEGWGMPRRLRITQDGGKTWAFVPGADGKPLELKGSEVSLSDPTDTNVLFAYNVRSVDKGKTWQPMAGCEGVFTFSPTTKTLFGKSGNTVVSSKDKGATWAKVADVPGGFSDIAVDQATGRVYVASEDHLKVWTQGAWQTIETPADQYGNVKVVTVAVDPKVPSVVYVGGPRNIYANQATICRSTDAGKTWRNLTVTTPLANGDSGGPHEVGCIRVHPVTREAWVAGQCYGMWRIAPPAATEKGQSAKLASAPQAVRPPIGQ